MSSHYDNHRRAAELHNLAAHAHMSAAEAHEKQDHETGAERTRQAHEHTQHAYEHVEEMQDANEHGIALFGHQEIARLAEVLWKARGCPEGSPQEDWYEAARHLRARGVKSGQEAGSEALTG